MKNYYFVTILVALSFLGASCHQICPPSDTENLAHQVEVYAESHPDGFTIHLPDFAVPTSGIVVSYSGAMHSYSELDVSSTVEHALLHDSVVGGWRNNEQNVYVYGSNRIFPEDSLEAAIAFGKANEQIAIYVLSCDSTIYLNK